MKRFLLAGLLLAAVFANPMQADFFQCPPACVGSDNADVINGSPAIDSILAGLGNDVIFAGDSRDGVGGEDGNDLIFGGLHSDNLLAGPGNDILIPGPDGAEDIQNSLGESGNDTFIVLVGETINCQFIFGGEDFDVLHLIGFGPYITEFPYGITGPIPANAFLVIQDPITGGYIFVGIEDGPNSVERINGVDSPTAMDLGGADMFFEQNCTMLDL